MLFTETKISFILKFDLILFINLQQKIILWLAVVFLIILFMVSLSLPPSFPPPSFPSFFPPFFKGLSLKVLVT